MKLSFPSHHPLRNLILSAIVALSTSSCEGIFNDIYDTPSSSIPTDSNTLYIDASNWQQWHYIDLKTISHANPSSDWITLPLSMPASEATPSQNSPQTTAPGIYTYYYDVYGQGLTNNKFRSFTPAPVQAEPENWTFAVHRNNVRTNGGAAHITTYSSIDQLPTDPQWLSELNYTPDLWNETDVWAVQDQMLSGLIGNQGIYINPVLSSWLKVSIPPIPPSFSHCTNVMILRLNDGTYAALQLANYMNNMGTKCCLTIKFKYPL